MADGRARGRSKSRGRARPPVEEELAPGRGPGPAITTTTAAAAAAPPSSTHPTAATGGRRNHRGVSRADVEDVTRGMAGAEISSESLGRGASRKFDFTLDNTRPAHIQDKTGTAGEKITVAANYFELLSKPQWTVQQYHVDFVPSVESPKIRRGLLATHKEILGACFLFDGMSDLKSIKKLEKMTELFSQRRTDGENIKITLKHVTELPPNHPELGRLYNTLMRRNLQHLEFTLLGRHYFDQAAVSEIPEYHLQIWQGVITTIRQQEEKLMMLVDSVHKVVRKDTALDVIRNLTRGGQDYKDASSRELIGSIVMTIYNNRTYSIEDIMWDMNPTMTFEAKKEQISYTQYYKKQYDLDIRDLRQPLLLGKSKEREIRGGTQESKKIYLVPEFSYMTGLTDQMRNNFQMMKELAKHTKLDPARRVNNLKTFMQRVKNNPQVQQEMEAWQLRFANEPITLQARILPAEPIVFKAGRVNFDSRTGDFSQSMRGNHLLVAADLQDWIIVHTKRDSQPCKDFVMNLMRVAPGMGMRVSNPTLVPIENDRVSSYIQAFKEARGAKTCLVCFIVPNNKKDRYDALKKNTCIDCPIPSQVIVVRTLMRAKGLMSVATKVAIQMNCKLGGEPWAVEIPLKMGVMIIGYDTYHDSSKRGRSAGAFVASMNSTFTRWYSRVSFHQAGGWAELSDHLKVNLTEALRKYQSINRQLPSLILFFRDGVGDGQIRYVKEWEVAQFERTVIELMEATDTDPSQMKTRYAFIVVNKRINTRFFQTAGNRYQNPPPGTVVDTVVTRYDRYDFFLVSQSVREGTVAPTMFNVIADRSNLKPEHLQRLSYKLTHLYFNFAGMIRVPAPCQFAHKLAFLAGQSLHNEPAPELSDRLFYL